MKAILKESAPCEKVLSVDVSGELIQEEFNLFYQHIEKDARVPGFRPGRAPRGVIETHFRTEAREKVLERLISRSFREAVGEKKIEFLGSPRIKDVQFTDDKLTYEALLEVPPTIRLGRYKGLTAEKKAVEINPDEIAQATERVQNSLAKFAAVEDRPAQMGDFLMADYTCRIDGKEVDKREDDWFELREEEFLKGFSTQLIGVKAGEEREIQIQFPSDFGRKEWAGKTGIFQIKIKEVKEKKLLALDDELAKETGEFETLDQLRDHLRQQIESDKTRQAEIAFENALLEALLKETAFEVPKGVVERRLINLVEQTAQAIYQRRMPQEVFEKEVAALYEKLRPEAERQVRLSFLLEAIAKKEKLELTGADFEFKYKEMGLRHRQTPEAVKKYYDEHPEAKDSLTIQILNEKAIQLIKDNAAKGK